MLNIEVTQFPNGVGNQRDNSVMNSLPIPGPNVALSVEDFAMDSDYVSIWAATALGAGSAASNPLSASGILQQTSAGAATDGNKFAANIGSDNDAFFLSAGTEAWFGVRLNTDDILNTILLLGFIPEADTVAPANGVFLRSVDGSADLEIVSRSANVEVATVLGSLQNNVDYEIAFYYDGIDKISAQFVGPDGVVGGGGTVLPAGLLPAVGTQPTFLYARGAAAGVTVLNVDYILFGGSR